MKKEDYSFTGERISPISIKETNIDKRIIMLSSADLQTCEYCQDATLFGLLMSEHHPYAAPLDNYKEPPEHISSGRDWQCLK